jgi:hypothetical protein
MIEFTVDTRQDSFPGDVTRTTKIEVIIGLEGGGDGWVMMMSIMSEKKPLMCQLPSLAIVGRG